MEIEDVGLELQQLEQHQKSALEKTQNLIKQIRKNMAKKPIRVITLYVAKNAGDSISVDEVVKRVSKIKGKKVGKQTIQSQITLIKKTGKIEGAGPGIIRYVE